MEDGKSFSGKHQMYDDSGNPSGYFVVFRINTDWYWQELHFPITPNPFGPYPTAEGAYLAAMGD